ncbi:hypothetical protein HPB47_006945 [Ixodes persulcatus]|uniref:Uncharacterized protein n=1 Tax=Ixodes persulcatus TaxID=34615 RepID=A0AC60P942_IXOPE|nr:hypothetical protein HPB47_006945 [Ixodes persulcatus]
MVFVFGPDRRLHTKWSARSTVEGATARGGAKRWRLATNKRGGGTGSHARESRHRVLQIPGPSSSPAVAPLLPRTPGVRPEQAGAPP